MPATPVSICNLALANIRVPAIISFTDGTTESDTCQQVYAEIYEQCLGEHRWRFAMTSKALSPVANIVPPAGWTQLWQVPSDLLQLHTLRGVGPTDAPYDPLNPWPTWEGEPPLFDRFGDKLVTNLPVNYTLVIYYTKLVSEAQLPPYFRKYLVASLQRTLAASITGHTEYVEDAKQEKEEALRKARLKDSQARMPPARTPTRLVSYR